MFDGAGAWRGLGAGKDGLKVVYLCYRVTDENSNTLTATPSLISPPYVVVPSPSIENLRHLYRDEGLSQPRPLQITSRVGAGAEQGQITGVRFTNLPGSQGCGRGCSVPHTPTRE